jgi:hypothetical protein
VAVVSLWFPVPGELLPGFAVPGELLPVGLTSVFPGKLDVGGEDEDGDEGGEDEDGDEGGGAGLELPEAGADVLMCGFAVLAGLGLAGQEGEPVVCAAFLLPGALVLAAAVAEADPDALAVLVALVLAVAAEVAEAVSVTVPVGEALSLGLTLVPPLPLALPLAVAVPEPAGDTTGSALPGLADFDALGDEVGEGHAVVAFALLGLAGELPGPAPPFAEPAALPEPARLGVPLLGLGEEIPTADPSETNASRSGGKARTTPMANTAQAAARIGLSSPSRQSRGCGRPWPPPSRAESSRPRPALQRPARKPAQAAGRLLAWADPDRTRARIRSSPSGWGST